MFFASLGWLDRLDAEEARGIFHHGGPIPICRVASGDIDVAFDSLKGYKPIDYAGAVFLAGVAGCRCALPDALDWDPRLLVLPVGSSSLEDQLLKTLENRMRFICAANDAVLEHFKSEFFK